MNAEQFVEAIADRAFHSAAEKWALMLVPPGRYPRPHDRELAAWLSGLQPQEKRLLRRLVYDCFHAGIFSMLTLMDGVGDRPTDAGPGIPFEVYYVGQSGRSQLSGGSVYLHELLPDRYEFMAQADRDESA